MTVRVIDKFVYLHSRIGGHAERASISKSNAELTIGAGLNNVTAIDQIPDFGLLGGIGGEIDLHENSGGMLNPNGPLHGKDLANRICIGSSTGVLAQDQIRTNAKGQ